MTWRVMAERCDECLFGPNAIVGNHRRQAVLEVCRREGRAFTCHKASMKGDNVSCRGYYDQPDRLLPLVAVVAKNMSEAGDTRAVTFVKEEDL